MTAHLEQAAAKATELAASLPRAGNDLSRTEAAAHLAYLAGLIRGGATPGATPVEDGDHLPLTSLPPVIRRAVSESLHAGLEHPDPKVRNAREQLYAAVTYGREADPRDLAVETTHLGRVTYGGRTELDELRRQAQACVSHPIEIEGLRRRVTQLRAAIKDLLDNDGDLIADNRRVALARTYRTTETPAEGAARLRVE